METTDKKEPYITPLQPLQPNTTPMASTKICTILTIAAILSPLALATEFIVGDDKGWNLNFNYQTWAQGKEFHVGDKLIFRYTKGAHNVLKVDAIGFQLCVAPPATEALSSGEDVIELATPGKKWYICGVGLHCETAKMKLLVTVLPMNGSSTTTPATSETSVGAEFVCHGWIVTIMICFLGMIMV